MPVNPHTKHDVRIGRVESLLHFDVSGYGISSCSVSQVLVNRRTISLFRYCLPFYGSFVQNNPERLWTVTNFGASVISADKNRPALEDKEANVGCQMLLAGENSGLELGHGETNWRLWDSSYVFLRAPAGVVISAPIFGSVLQ